MEAMIQSPAPKPTFLTLPVEIRMMIFELLAHDEQPPLQPRSYPYDIKVVNGRRQFARNYTTRPDYYTETLDRSHDSFYPQLTLFSVQLTSKQLYYETRGFSSPPFTIVTLLADPRDPSILDGAVALMLADTRPRTCFVGVEITCNYLPPLDDDQDTGEREAFKKYRRDAHERLGESVLGRCFFRLFPRKLDLSSFEAAIQSLELFPNLGFVQIGIHHGKAPDWFRRSPEYANLLTPLIERGVSIESGAVLPYRHVHT